MEREDLVVADVAPAITVACKEFWIERPGNDGGCDYCNFGIGVELCWDLNEVAASKWLSPVECICRHETGVCHRGKELPFDILDRGEILVAEEVLSAEDEDGLVAGLGDFLPR